MRLSRMQSAARLMCHSSEYINGERDACNDEQPDYPERRLSGAHRQSSGSSFYNVADMKIEDGDFEYIIAAEKSPRGEASPVHLDTEERGLGPKEAGEQRIEQVTVSAPETGNLPQTRSRVQRWLDALDGDHFEDPDLAGPFPPNPLALPDFISRLPSFSRRPVALPLDQEVNILADQCKPSSEASPMNRNKKALRQRKSRSLESRERSPSPIHGSFISVSPGRSRSLSPDKRLARQSVHINMNLTESQMDRITNAFSSHVGSPARLKTSNADGRSSRTTQASTAPSAKNADENGSSDRKRKSLRLSPFDSMPRYGPEEVALSTAATLAQGRQQDTPDYIDVDDARKLGTFVRRSSQCPVSTHPLQYDSAEVSPLAGEISSVYSQDLGDRSMISPYIKGDTVSQKIDNVMNTYNGWDITVESVQPPRVMSPGRENTPVLEPSPSRGAETMARTDALKNSEAGNATYSPLITYFAFEGLPAQKMGGKTMIGDQGWLERPGNQVNHIPDQSKRPFSPKKLGLIDSIKKMAKDMTENKNSRRPREIDRPQKTPKMTISLDPREQSLLYCELEFHVSNALHTYITNELNHGRLDPNKFKKVADGWNHKGRPKVVGFRYDLETQLNLVDLHIEDFRFFGRRQGNPVEISGLLHAMKVNSRAMRVRTFCQPDSVIAKQLVDSQSLFNALGCSDSQQVSLAEIAQFFKVIVEREKHYRDRLSRAAGETHPGQHWEPQFGEESVPKGAFEVYGSVTVDGEGARQPGRVSRYSD